MAGVAGISLHSVQRIWQAHHRLQPHRIRTFDCSNDPAVAAKLEDLVGLYVGHVPFGGVGAVGRWPAAATAMSLA
jgi:hypothetical protein